MTSTLPIRTISRPGEPTVELLPPEPELKTGILTTEFWTTIGGIVINLVTVLAAIGYLNQSDAQTLTTSLGGILAAAQALVVNGALVWKYVQSRTQAKTEIAAVRLEMRAALRAEQLRLSYQAQPSE